MNKKIYKDISDELQSRRTKAMLLSDKRKEEIYSAIPKVALIDEKICSIGIELGLMTIRGSSNKEELIARLNSLIMIKKDLIKQSGYSENYIDDVYECKQCNDTGHILYGNEFARCDCFKRLLIDKLMYDSNVSYLGGTFSTFDLRVYPDEINEVKYGVKCSPRTNMAFNLKRCKEFVENFRKRNEDNMIFVGKAGLGKTFLCNSIALALLEKGIPVLYLNAPVLFSTISAIYSKDDLERERAKQIYNLMSSVELLIIDDLGTESQTATRYAELLEILNARELLSKKRTCKTIISTNLEPQNIFKFYGERVASRIYGGFELLMFAGEDVRVNLRMNKINVT